MSQKRISQAQFSTELQKRVKKAGSQRAFAKATGISAQYLSDVLAGRRNPGPKLYGALGFSGTETVFLESA